ncbi:hypothetical protein PP715_21110, partial [Ralstonia solanacearum]
MDEDLHRLVDERESVFKVVVFLPEDAWHKFSSELLWAEALEDGTMRILNIPFFAKGLRAANITGPTARSGLSYEACREEKSAKSCGWR